MENESLGLILLQQIISGIPDIAVIVNKEGLVIGFNSLAETHLGYNEKDLIGKRVVDLPFFTDTSRVTAMDHFQERMDGKELKPYNLEFLTKDGQFRSGTIYGHKIINESIGLEVDLVVIKLFSEEIKPQEVKELESAQKALKESEERYKFLVNSSNEYILIVSLTGKILFANQATVKNFGFPEEEIIGKSITSFLAPKSAAKVAPAILQAFLGKNPSQFDIYTKTKEGGFRIVENNSKSLAFIKSGNSRGLLIFGRDVTEQRKAEAEIEKSENRFKAIFQHTPIAYVMFSEDGKIVDVNPAALDLFKMTLFEFQNKSIEEIGLFDKNAMPQIQAGFNEVLSQDNLKTIEVKGTSKDGQTLLLQIDIYKLEFDKNNMVIAGIRNIAQQKKFEEEMLAKNEELEKANKLMIGRELKMVELKTEIDRLNKQILGS
jgi:PAS domain S-box-containing protein